MAPQLRLVDRPSVEHEILTQWRRPSDILSLLMLLGSDIVQRAIAQQAGDPHLPTPVVFSFGWVAYAFTGLLSAVGDNLLMPPSPDTSSILISIPNGYPRANQSWILGRVLRDFEVSWMTKDARAGLEALLEKKNAFKASLCISVWEPTSGAQPKVPTRDWVWWSGYVVLLLQFGLASVAWGCFGNWVVFTITLGGSILALTTASLPQWRRERWACRERTKKSFVLCRGNGCQHALLIRGTGAGIDMEDLASTGQGTTTQVYTRLITAFLAALWIVLLITVAGMKQQTWFLVGIGALGMMHTVFVAGKSRSPSAFGIHLTYREYILGEKAMQSLMEVEEKYPGVGIAMLPIFFPGELKYQEEVEFWNGRKKTKKLELHSSAFSLN
ncbi:MAG: hypothetical protein Q9163_004760 [Psora crenata]